MSVLKRIFLIGLFFSITLAVPAQWGYWPWELLSDYETEIDQFEQSRANKWTMYQPDQYADSTKVWSLEKNSFDSSITLLLYKRNPGKISINKWLTGDKGIRIKRKAGAWRIEEVYALDSLYTLHYFQAFLPDVGWGRNLPVDTLILDTLPPKDEPTRMDLGEVFGRWVFLRGDLKHPVRFEYNFRRNVEPLEIIGVDFRDSLLLGENVNVLKDRYPTRNDTIWLAGVDELDGAGRVSRRWNMEYLPGEGAFNEYVGLKRFVRISETTFSHNIKMVEHSEWDQKKQRAVFERLFFSQENDLRSFEYCIPGIGTTKKEITIVDFPADKTSTLQVKTFGRMFILSRDQYSEGVKSSKTDYDTFLKLRYNTPEREHFYKYDEHGRCVEEKVVEYYEKKTFENGSIKRGIETKSHTLHYEYNDQNLVERIYRQSLDTNYVAPGEPHPKVLYQFSEFEWEE